MLQNSPEGLFHDKIACFNKEMNLKQNREMKKLFLAATLVLASIGIVSAQSRPTFRLDANFVGSNMTTKIGSVSATGSMLAGFRVGGAAEFAIGQDGFYIAPGVAYTMKGAKEASSDYSRWVTEGVAYTMKGAKDDAARSRLHYLQVPINAGFRASFAQDMTVSLEVGPYLAYGVAGNTTLKNSDLSVDAFGDKGALKRFDMGLGIAAALGYQRYYFQVGYDHGILNVAQKGSSDFSIRNYDFFVGVGVRF